MSAVSLDKTRDYTKAEANREQLVQMTWSRLCWHKHSNLLTQALKSSEPLQKTLCESILFIFSPLGAVLWEKIVLSCLDRSTQIFWHNHSNLLTQALKSSDTSTQIVWYRHSYLLTQSLKSSDTGTQIFWYNHSNRLIQSLKSSDTITQIFWYNHSNRLIQALKSSDTGTQIFWHNHSNLLTQSLKSSHTGTQIVWHEHSNVLIHTQVFYNNTTETYLCLNTVIARYVAFLNVYSSFKPLDRWAAVLAFFSYVTSTSLGM